MRELFQFDDHLKISEKEIMKHKGFMRANGRSCFECPYEDYIRTKTNFSELVKRDGKRIEPYTLNGSQDTLHDLSIIQMVIDPYSMDAQNGLIVKCRYSEAHIYIRGCYMRHSWVGSRKSIRLDTYEIIHGRFCRKFYCELVLEYRNRSNRVTVFSKNKTVFWIDFEVWNCYDNWRSYHRDEPHKCDKNYCRVRKWLTSKGRREAN